MGFPSGCEPKRCQHQWTGHWSQANISGSCTSPKGCCRRQRNGNSCKCAMGGARRSTRRSVAWRHGNEVTCLQVMTGAKYSDTLPLLRWWLRSLREDDMSPTTADGRNHQQRECVLSLEPVNTVERAQGCLLSLVVDRCTMISHTWLELYLAVLNTVFVLVATWWMLFRKPFNVTSSDSVKWRTVATQSMCTYRRKLSVPRFDFISPRQEDGCWVME